MATRTICESLLVTNLNHIITGPSLYDSNRFQGIRLRLETEELRRQNPRGQDLIRLNRRLLEDAYPAELRHQQSAPGAVSRPSRSLGKTGTGQWTRTKPGS